jgi:serine/threonine-protein phosphatase 2A regulatory subunit A
MSQGALELLKEEMDNDDVYVRINAIHRIKVIATLLGSDGVKN